MSISNTNENEYLIYTSDQGIPIKQVRELNLDIREIIDNEKELSLTYSDANKIKISNEFDTISRVVEKTSFSNSIFFPGNNRFNWNNFKTSCNADHQLMKAESTYTLKEKKEKLRN